MNVGIVRIVQRCEATLRLRSDLAVVVLFKSRQAETSASTTWQECGVGQLEWPKFERMWPRGRVTITRLLAQFQANQGLSKFGGAHLQVSYL